MRQQMKKAYWDVLRRYYGCPEELADTYEKAKAHPLWNIRSKVANGVVYDFRADRAEMRKRVTQTRVVLAGGQKHWAEGFPGAPGMTEEVAEYVAWSPL